MTPSEQSTTLMERHRRPTDATLITPADTCGSAALGDRVHGQATSIEQDPAVGILDCAS
jgi:hypothetical protein